MQREDLETAAQLIVPSAHEEAVAPQVGRQEVLGGAPPFLPTRWLCTWVIRGWVANTPCEFVGHPHTQKGGLFPPLTSRKYRAHGHAPHGQFGDWHGP